VADNRGIPLDGDRGAFDTVNYAERHAKDIEDDTLKRHLPEPSADGTYARDDGNNWAAQLGLLLADLTDWVRGSLIVGGAAVWEALGIGAADTVLKSNGTDAAWGNVGHDELTDITDSDHHNPITLAADADVLLALNDQEVQLDNQTAYTVFAGPAGGGAADPTFRALVNADLPDPSAFKTAPSTKTISGGAITATQNLHIIAAEAGVTDDLDTINGLVDRQFLLLKADAGDTITVKHGTGNIHFDSGDDFDLSGDSWLLLFFDGTKVVALGAGGGGAADAADVTYTPTVAADWDGDADPGNVNDALDQLAERVTDLEESGAVGASWAVDGALAVITDVNEPWIMPEAGTILEVIAVVGENGSAGSTIVDVHKNGGTIFTVQADRPTIAHDDADRYDVGTPDVTAFNQYDEFTMDIDQVATGAENLRVILVIQGSTGAGGGGGGGGGIEYIDSVLITADQTTLYADTTENIDGTLLTFTPDSTDDLFEVSFSFTYQYITSGWPYAYVFAKLDGTTTLDPGTHRLWSQESSAGAKRKSSHTPIWQVTGLSVEPHTLEMWIRSVNNCQVQIFGSVFTIKKLS